MSILGPELTERSRLILSGVGADTELLLMSLDEYYVGQHVRRHMEGNTGGGTEYGYHGYVVAIGLIQHNTGEGVTRIVPWYQWGTGVNFSIGFGT